VPQTMSSSPPIRSQLILELLQDCEAQPLTDFSVSRNQDHGTPADPFLVVTAGTA
jgi:hypothetical protein